MTVSPLAPSAAVHFGRMPARRLAGMTERYASAPEAMQTLGGQWQRLVTAVRPFHRESRQPELFGVFCGLFDEPACTYTTAIEIGAADPVLAGLEALEVPALPVAILTHDGTVETIGEALSAFLRTDLPQSGRSLRVPRPFDLIERYGEAFDPATRRDDIELWIPGR